MTAAMTQELMESDGDWGGRVFAGNRVIMTSVEALMLSCPLTLEALAQILCCDNFSPLLTLRCDDEGVWVCWPGLVWPRAQASSSPHTAFKFPGLGYQIKNSA